MLKKLFAIIENRKQTMPDNSYTATLLAAGKKRLWEKIAEESNEVITASKQEGRKRIIEETADLIYHVFVLLAFENIQLTELEKELTKRSKT